MLGYSLRYGICLGICQYRIRMLRMGECCLHRKWLIVGHIHRYDRRVVDQESGEFMPVLHGSTTPTLAFCVSAVTLVTHSVTYYMDEFEIF